MGLLQRLLGICTTPLPADAGCWRIAGGRLVIDLARAAELAAGEGALRFEGGGLPCRVLVVHAADGSYHAFRNRCTHGGRRLDLAVGEPALRCCSVGQSTFTLDGGHRSGPARGDLGVLPITASATELQVELPAR